LLKHFDHQVYSLYRRQLFLVELVLTLHTTSSIVSYGYFSTMSAAKIADC
jgi:hypothetical protein